MTRIYSYVVRYDSGFAPNPFGEYCTLATCKPRIRKKIKIGDWVVGTGSVEYVGNIKLIYAMKVEEKISFDQYDRDKRFSYKIPTWFSSDKIKKVGDNIYFKDPKGVYYQRPSNHSNRDGSENEELKQHDLSGEFVLISKLFCYFGKKAVEIPKKIQDIIKKGPGHKCTFPENLITNFLNWLKTKYGLNGCQGSPYLLSVNLDICHKCIEYDGTPKDDEE